MAKKVQIPRRDADGWLLSPAGTRVRGKAWYARQIAAEMMAYVPGAGKAWVARPDEIPGSQWFDYGVRIEVTR